MVPQEMFTLDNEDTPKIHDTYTITNYLHYNNTSDTHLDLHKTTHKYHITPRDMENELPNTTRGCGNCGQTPMPKGGRRLPISQGLPKEIPHPHTLPFSERGGIIYWWVWDTTPY